MKDYLIKLNEKLQPYGTVIDVVLIITLLVSIFT